MTLFMTWCGKTIKEIVLLYFGIHKCITFLLTINIFCCGHINVNVWNCYKFRRRESVKLLEKRKQTIQKD